MGSINNQNKLAELSAKIDAAVPARARLLSLFDADSFVELDAFAGTDGAQAGIVAGYGLIEGDVVYAFSQDVSQDHGAVSAAHAKKAVKVYQLAAKTGCPVVGIYDSKGAKLNEGGAMLAAYSEMLMWSNNLSGVVPQIAVVLGTCGGASAMLAAGADLMILSRDAELFMTAPFVAKANGDSTKDAGSAESAAKAGVASLVCEDEAAALEQTRRILTMLPKNNLASAPYFDFAGPTAALEPEGCPKEIVKAVADEDSVVELSCDYSEGIFTFLGTMAGTTAAFVATSRTHPLDGAACEKAAKFMRFCDAFNIPVITLLNSSGFALDSDVSVVKAAARLASAYAEATTPKISVISGRAFGPAYLALGSRNANADAVIAWPQAEISALAPETAVEFLWADRYAGTEDAAATRAALRAEYAETEASPFTAAESGYVEAVIAPEDTRKTLVKLLDMLSGKRETKLPKKHITL